MAQFTNSYHGTHFRTRYVTADNNAEELRVLCIFAFPIVADAVGQRHAKAEELLMLLAFVARAYTMDNLYEEAKGEKYTRRFILRRFSKKYTDYLTQYNATPCFHVLSHLEQIRKPCPPWRSSCFIFEKSYAPLKKHFRYAHHGHLKRALVASYEYNGFAHCCRKKVRYGWSTARTDDRKVFTYKDSVVRAYDIIRQVGEFIFTCREYRLQSYIYDCPEGGPSIDFGRVWCFRDGGLTYKLVDIRLEDIRGKVMLVDGKLIMIPLELLHETL